MKADLYTRLYLWLHSHRWLVFSASALIVVLCVYLSSRMNLEEDIMGMLPQHDKLVDDYRYTLRKFRQIDRVFIDVGTTNENTDALGEAADAFYGRLSANPVYGHITYRVEIAGMRKTLDLLTGSLPDLFTEADAKALEAKLAAASIKEYLTVMRRKLAGPEGAVLKNVVAADPIGMTGLVGDKILPLQAGFGEAQVQDDRIVSSDGHHILMLAEPTFPSSNSKDSESLVRELLGHVHAVEQQFPGVHIAVTGGHRMSVDNATLIKSDTRRCLFLGMASMLVLCLTAFRRRWLSVVTFLPSFFGTLVAGVVLALGWHSVSAIATGFASIAIGITVDYAIYVVYHLDDAAGLDRPAVGEHIGRLVLPISVGALTTIAAFLVMASSPMRGYQQLGAFGAVGVLFSAAFALVILPLLVPIPKKTGQPPLWLTRLLGNFHIWRGRSLPLLLLSVLALTIFTAIGVRRLRFEGDVTKFNGITKSTRADDAVIRKTWGDALSMTMIVARGVTVEEALQQDDRIAEALSHEPGVKSFSSLSSVCPSLAVQKENLARWQSFWTPSRKNQLRATVGQIAADLGFRKDAFDLFWQHLDQTPPPLTPDAFRGTPLEQPLQERIALAPGDNAVSTLVKLQDRSQVRVLRQVLPNAIVLDQEGFAAHIAQMASSSMGRFALWTSILVALIVHFSLTSIELVVATLLPLAFGLLWTFGLMGWLGLPIDMMNSVFVIFIIGVGEDYSIFLVTSKLDEWRGRPARIAATSASVLISALTTTFGFAVLAFARHPVLFSLGTTVLLGMACSFTATLILAPFLTDLILFKNPPRGAPRWWHLLGTLWVTIHLGSSELFLWYVWRPILRIFSPSEADARLRRTTRRLARSVVRGLPFGKLECRDINPEIFARPAIVISNHQSAVDVMLMVALPGDVRQTAKKRVFDTPTLGVGCKLCGHVMVEPNDPQTTLQRCREKLTQGASVHFFPEGTRSPDGAVQRFHRGAFELAVDLKQDVMPIVLCDTWTAMPRDTYWFEPYHVIMKALPRITPQSFDFGQGSLALMRYCEELIRDELHRLLQEVNTDRVLRRKVKRLYRYQGIFVEQFIYWKMKKDPMFSSLNGLVPRRAFVLDLGCGYGIASHWLAYGSNERTCLGIDYDEDKIRIAKRSAAEDPRVRFETGDILAIDYPQADVMLLLDVLHYWVAEKQEMILNKIAKALRPGGSLILRDAAADGTASHRKVEFWERFALFSGQTLPGEGLHFQTRDELVAALKTAGFARWEIKPEAGLGSNILIVAYVLPLPQ
jgi:uncharacterized protein